jgi:excisionase family DNA binding protein
MTATTDHRQTNQTHSLKRQRRILLMKNTTLETQPVEKLLDAGDLAALLGICRQTAERAARAGKIPSIKIGRRVRFSREHVRHIFEHGYANTPEGEKNALPVD